MVLSSDTRPDIERLLIERLRQMAAGLGVSDLLERALEEAGPNG